MKVAYYLNETRNKNLYCRISDGADRVSFSLAYTVDPKMWNAKKEEGAHDDPYYYTLMDFKKYLEKRYHELKSSGSESVLKQLKDEAEAFVDGSGIDGIARKMFDDENKASGLPTYDQFKAAFEKYSELSNEDYKAQAVGNTIFFYTKSGEVYEMDTYAGLTARLKSFLEHRSFDEFAMMTDSSIWGEIYTDGGIEKHVFIPRMLGIWEMYWAQVYENIQKEGIRTDHLPRLKEESWRQFQVFMACYEDGIDVISLAYRIDSLVLYPMAVVTMLKVFNPDVCFLEYCETEFDEREEWESISLRDDEDCELDDDSPIFHIRLAEV